MPVCAIQSSQTGLNSTQNKTDVSQSFLTEEKWTTSKSWNLQHQSTEHSKQQVLQALNPAILDRDLPLQNKSIHRSLATKPTKFQRCPMNRI